MALELHWTGRSDLNRIGELRWRCYAAAGKDRQLFHARTARGAWGDGDVCIAVDDGQDVGTATSLSMHLHARGKRVPCQGVAWVGTVKSHRRRTAGQRGVASQVMAAMADKARERGEIVSALMPFRASFYSHFGYGIVERQNVWTIPLSLLPEAPPPARWRFGSTADAPAMLACRAAQAAAGQCDVETSPPQLNEWLEGLDADAQLFVDDRGDRVAAHAWLRESIENDTAVANVVQPAWENASGMVSLLGLLRGLRDQYATARLALPVDVPLNWLLGEPQVPHRRVDHPAAACRSLTRMQLRVLDPIRFLDGQALRTSVSGKVVAAVRTIEGHTTTLELSIDEGRVSAKSSSASADVVCDEATFAALCTGALPAAQAAALGLIDLPRPTALPLLSALGEGPQPFCYEYF
ncbi:MAG TPA: GNAT family N-acetyltransferase [Tepidisphaeraceae bacterium]|jgi:predicted acetyltransferase